MKINNDFIVHNDNGEILLVSTGAASFSGMIHSNSTAGFIIECLENGATEDEIVEKMLAKWDVSDEDARRDVNKIVSKLREIGALDE